MSDLTTRLNEAENALHSLLTGSKAVKVKKDGREVEFTPVDINQLRSYIATLQHQLKITSTRRRPVGVGL